MDEEVETWLTVNLKGKRASCCNYLPGAGGYGVG